MELLQVNDSAPALQDEIAKAIINETMLSQFPVDGDKGQLRIEAIDHFQHAMRVVRSITYVFDTMWRHLEMLGELGPDDPLPPSPDEKMTTELYPDVFPEEIRAKIRYYTNERLLNVTNMAVYGNLVDLSMVYNAMLAAYREHQNKISDMELRIPGNRDRYSAMRNDMLNLFEHLVRLAENLEEFFQKYPDELLDRSMPASELEDRKRTVRKLLKEFRVFTLTESKEAVDQGSPFSVEEEEKEEKGTEFKLISQEALRIIILAYDQYIEHPRAKEEDKKEAERDVKRWSDLLTDRIRNDITDQDGVPCIILAIELPVIYLNLVKFRKQTGMNVDSAMEELDKISKKPIIDLEAAKYIVKTALVNSRVRRAAEEEENQPLVDEVKRLDQRMEEAVDEGDNAEYVSLAQESKRLQDDLKLLVARAGQELDEKEIARIVSQSVTSALGAPEEKKAGIQIEAVLLISTLILLYLISPGRKRRTNRRRDGDDPGSGEGRRRKRRRVELYVVD